MLTDTFIDKIAPQQVVRRLFSSFLFFAVAVAIALIFFTNRSHAEAEGEAESSQAQVDPDVTMAASQDEKFKGSDGSHEMSWLPGERWDMLTGEMSFYHVDIDIPGDNELPVRLAHIVGNKGGANYSWDIPRLSFSTHGGGVKWEKVDDNNYYIITQGQKICSGFRQAQHVDLDVHEPSEGGREYSTRQGTKYLRSGLKFHFGEQTVHFFAKSAGASRFPAEALYVSPDNWYMTCAGNGAFKVHTNSGWIYTLSRWVHPQGSRHLGSLESTAVTVFATQIEDARGNYVRYQYGSYAGNTNPEFEFAKHRLQAIYSNDGRRLNFTKAGAYTWDVDAEGGTSPVRRRYYSRKKNFQIRDENDDLLAYAFGSRNGSGYQVQRVTYPSGGHVDYEYKYLSRVDYLNGYATRLPSAVRLTKRTTSDGGVYEFSSHEYSDNNAAGEARNFIARTIKTPSTLLEYRMQKSERNDMEPRRAKTADGNSGRLVSFRNHGQPKTWNKDLRPAYQRDYQWLRLAGLADLEAIFSIRLPQADDVNNSKVVYLERPWGAYFNSWKVVLNDERTRYFPTPSTEIAFSREYSNWDAFGNPQRLTEYSNDGLSRVTDTEYWQSGSGGSWFNSYPAVTTTYLGSGRGNDVVRNSYLKDGSLSSVSKNGITTSYSYHSNGMLASTTDAEGHTHQYNSYFRGIPGSETNRNGETLTRRVDADGTIASESSWGGAHNWTYLYDNKRRLRKTFTPGNSGDIDIEWITPAHRRETQGNRVTDTHFDGLGREIFNTSYDRYNSVDRVSFVKRYDDQGRLIFASFANILTFPTSQSYTTDRMFGTHYQYDGLDRVLETRSIHNANDASAAFGRVRYRYNLRGFSFRTNDGRGKWRSERLRAFGSPDGAVPVSITDVDGDTTIDIERDLSGRPLSTTRDGLRRSWNYSSTTQLLYSETNPEHGETVYNYYNDGKVSKSSNQNRETRFSYTPDNQLRTSESIADGKQLKQLYNYDSRGLITSLETQSSGYPANQATFVSYQYDAENNLINEKLDVDGRSMEIAYRYDGHGSMNQITYPTGRSYDLSPDPMGRSRKIIQIGGEGKIIFEDVKYFANGLMRQASRPNINMTQSLDSRTGYPFIRSTRGRNNTLHMTRRYNYDESLNISKITHFMAGKSISMGYDNQNRLISASSQEIGDWAFDYDSRDNISFSSHNGVVSNYYYNRSANRLDRVETGGERKTYQYDSRGNITNNGDSSIQYMANDHVVAVDNETYVYDGHGRRVLTRTSSGNKIYQFYGLGGSLRYRFDAGAQTHSEYHYVAGKLLARRDSGHDGNNTPDDGSQPGDGDGSAPSAPIVTGEPKSSTSIEISWTESTDSDGSIYTYEVYRNGELSRTAAGRRWWQNDLASDTDYRYEVVAIDNDGNRSIPSTSIVIRTNP